MKHLTGLISHRPVSRSDWGRSHSIHSWEVRLGALAWVSFNRTRPWYCQETFRWPTGGWGNTLSPWEQQPSARYLVLSRYHQHVFETFDIPPSVLSGAAGPPSFRSPRVLFLEPEPSRLCSALRCGLCHSDPLSSNLLTSGLSVLL